MHTFNVYLHLHRIFIHFLFFFVLDEFSFCFSSSSVDHSNSLEYSIEQIAMVLYSSFSPPSIFFFKFCIYACACLSIYPHILLSSVLTELCVPIERSNVLFIRRIPIFLSLLSLSLTHTWVYERAQELVCIYTLATKSCQYCRSFCFISIINI